MKLVRESINEIKQEKSTGLGAIGLGKESMIKQWASQNFDEFRIYNNIIIPSDPDEYPTVKMVRSGKIPDYVNIIAYKPYEILKKDDIVTDFSEMPLDYHVIAKLEHTQKDLQKIIDNFYGSGVYDNRFKRFFDQKMNAVLCVRYDGSIETKVIKLYDYHVGVIGTFIYEGSKSYNFLKP